VVWEQAAVKAAAPALEVAAAQERARAPARGWASDLERGPAQAMRAFDEAARVLMAGARVSFRAEQVLDLHGAPVGPMAWPARLSVAEAVGKRPAATALTPRGQRGMAARAWGRPDCY
jgi:hypothetical protein